MKIVCKGLQRNCCTLLCCRNNDGGLSKRCRIATRWWAQQPSSIAIVSPMHLCWQQCNLAVFACQNAMKSSEKAIIAVHIGWNISEIWIKKDTDSDQNVKLGQTFSMFFYIFRSFSGHGQLAVFWRFKSSVASPPSASWIGACGRRSWQNGTPHDSLKVLVACYIGTR